MHLFSVILHWCTEVETIERVMNHDHRISMEEIRPRIHPALKDNDHLLEGALFQPSALRLLRSKIAVLKSCFWKCMVCYQSIESVRNIGCDRCLGWSHFSCQLIKEEPRAELFFCRSCKGQSL